MNDHSAKINILARLREALGNKTPNPFPNIENNSFPELNKEDYPEIIFAKKFQEWGGKFIYCENRIELLKNLSRLCADKKIAPLYTADQTLIKKAENINFKSLKYGLPESGSYSAITYCDALIAENGAIMISNNVPYGQLYASDTENLLIIATASQVSFTIAEAMADFQKWNGAPAANMLVIEGISTVYNEDFVAMPGSGAKQIYIFMIDEE